MEPLRAAAVRRALLVFFLFGWVGVGSWVFLREELGPPAPPERGEPAGEDTPEAARSAEDRLRREVREARARARRDAEKAFPDPAASWNPLSTVSSEARGLQQREKREDMERKLAEKYLRQIAARHGVTLERLAELSGEAKAPR
jgi:hypothetical protein